MHYRVEIVQCWLTANHKGWMGIVTDRATGQRVYETKPKFRKYDASHEAFDWVFKAKLAHQQESLSVLSKE